MTTLPARKSTLVTLSAFLALIGLLLTLGSEGPGVGMAVASKGKDKQRLERARKRAARLDRAQQTRSGQISETQAAARRAGLAEMTVLAQLERSARRKRSLVLELGEANRELKAAEARERRALAQLSDRLVDIYRNPHPDYIGLLLGADSFEELQTTAHYLQVLHSADEAVAKRVEEVRLDIQRRHTEIVDTKRDLERSIADLTAQREAFVAARRRARIAVNELLSAQRRGAAALDSARGEVDRIRSEINGTPLYGGGPYAIPTYIVMCESGGNYRALNSSSGAGGAYQILPSTWKAYGGKGLPHLASKAEQDRIAALIWRDSGPGAWVCA